MKLSPNSAIEPEQLGKVPGRLGSLGWSGYSFIKERGSAELAATIDRTGANVGMMGDYFPALDIDVKSKSLAQAVLGLAADFLGEAPARTSRDPRMLLVYRTDEPFARMALVVTHKGISHLIEFLGKDRQYLVHGTHPSGAKYGWVGRPLWKYKRDEDIPFVTREQVINFFNTLQEYLESSGLECERIGDGATREQKEAPPQENLEAPSIEALAVLVAKIPNNSATAPDWDAYIKFGHAIKAAAGDSDYGLTIYRDWVARCERVPGDIDDAEQHWERMHAPHRVGWSWLVEQAQAAGVHNSAEEEFEADLDESPPAPPARDRQVDFTDEWAVAKLLPSCTDNLRYVPGVGSAGMWFTWEGHRWRQDQGMKHERFVRGKLLKLALWLQDQGHELSVACETKAERKEIAGPYFSAAKRYQSADGIASVVKLLRARVACSPTDFDKDPMMLNTPGGIVDLSTGAITPSLPAAMFSRSVTVAPLASTSGAPMWEAFLHDLTGGDEQLREFVRKMCGYALTGDISEKALWFVWGSDSDTGKSTFIRALSLLLGDYADSVDIDAFVGGKERIPADLARLPGVRLVTAAEPAAGQSWDERRIKAITGGDEISARYLYGQWFNYVPQFKIIIVGNHSPEIKQVDDAMLRRIHIVPFNRKVPREKQIDNLAKRMIDEEGPQILHWLIEGCLAWQKDGLTPPAAVRAKTGEYVDDEDTLAQWLGEECEIVKDAEVSRQELYQAWSAWCRSRGEDPGGAKGFKHKLEGKKRTLRIEETQVGDRRLRGYRGLRLRLKTEEGTEFESE